MTRTVRILGQGARGMARNRARTFFMMLGTFVGILALTVILAIGQSTQRAVSGRMQQMFSGATMMLRAGGGQMRGGAHGAPASTLTLADIEAIGKEFPEMIAADPTQGANAVGEFEGQSKRLGIQGHAETAERVWNRSVTSGRYFTADQVATAARVALVGEVVVRELFQGRDPIGQQVRVGAVPLQVIGVLEHQGLDPHGIDLDNIIIVPITTMLRRIRNIDYIAGARLMFREGADLDALEPRIGELLRRRHGLLPDQPDDFGIFTPRQAQQRVREANKVFTVFLPLAAGLAILVGALVVANLMLMTVQERRAEIGLRKALGARPADIRFQFLAEAAVVTGIAGVLAVLAGAGLILAMRLRGMTASMQWETALLGLGLAVAVGMLAGALPARRAAALDPVATLR